ncbi:adrenocortical dysplasia protein homolog [Xiphophorus couchianus]|uniref:adrenocortical dysplasia protein homolog n=1 Tax=Xiphophorus couchianus TaxID=32473 RepID=UPI001015EF47|nr:uncharacterized protein LOC114136070 [Xiphophorus couchianus]
MPPWSKLTPWIENLILSYGNGDESGSQLRAHVIGVGQMTQSQARGSDGPKGLLFLSDGELKIPAVLTASAWEQLQEKEDRECFSSLLNTTVCLQDYRLRFHMDPEQTKSRFFLSVGELATTAAGPVKDNTPCCTSSASVRMKICRTWRSLLGQEDSQRSQTGLDLSELLGEWQHDCLQTLLRDIRERLLALRNPRPSTSAYTPPPNCTRWDLDRVRYKGEPSFTFPAKLLLIPYESKGQACSVQDVEWQITEPAGGDPVQSAGTAGDAGERCPLLMEDVAPFPDPTALLSANPWDMFPPLGISPSTSDSSPESTPKLDAAAMVTSTRLPVASTQLPVPSFLPPYQNQPAASFPPSSSAVTVHQSPPEPPASDGTDTVPESYRKPKRKRCEAEQQEEEEEEEVSGSPPSWLFDSHLGTPRNEDSPKQTRPAPKNIPGTHGDGRPFSYKYRVSDQNHQDFSRFRVAASLLHWALRYLLTPKPTEDPQSVD